jgi:predicted PurR-regulated permease PerM
MPASKPVSSPRWGSMTKLVVALTFVAILAWVFARFQSIIAPLLMAFILSYLFYPIASLLNRKVHLSWRASVGLIYLFFVILLLSLLTVGGLGLIQQIQSLIRLVENSLTELPGLLSSLVDWVNLHSPFPVDVTTLDIKSVADQLLAVVQPLLGQTGQLLGTLAGGAAQGFGWGAFVLLVSFFVLSESGGLRADIFKFYLPGYNEDFARLGRELGRIWNAFLRGQIILFLLSVMVYSVLLSGLGLRYALGLALLAGLARFLPYVGPAINWIVLVLVAYFQVFKLFGMSPLVYTLVVVALAAFVDLIFDNLLSPRIMADALKVHPAGVLVMAIVAANLLGILGVIIAAPFLATLQLVSRYVFRKMFDQDPWPDPESDGGETLSQTSLTGRLQRAWQRLLAILRRSTPEKKESQSNPKDLPEGE